MKTTLIAVFALFVLALPAQAHNGQFRQNFRSGYRQNFNRGHYQQNFRQNFRSGYYQQSFRQRFVQPYCSQPAQIISEPYCEPEQIIVAPQQIRYSAPVQYQYTQPVQVESGCGCNGSGQLQRYRVRGY